MGVNTTGGNNHFFSGNDISGWTYNHFLSGCESDSIHCVGIARFANATNGPYFIYAQ
jgi:hypothetical protein